MHKKGEGGGGGRRKGEEGKGDGEGEAGGCWVDGTCSKVFLQFLRDDLSSPSAVFSSYTHIPYTEIRFFFPFWWGGGGGGGERSTECGQKRRNV